MCKPVIQNPPFLGALSPQWVQSLYLSSSSGGDRPEPYIASAVCLEQGWVYPGLVSLLMNWEIMKLSPGNLATQCLKCRGNSSILPHSCLFHLDTACKLWNRYSFSLTCRFEVESDHVKLVGNSLSCAHVCASCSFPISLWLQPVLFCCMSWIELSFQHTFFPLYHGYRIMG